MGFAETKQALLKCNDDFLEMLRPYRGLKPEVYHRLIEALVAIREDPPVSALVDRDVICSLWNTCSLALNWGVRPRGMLVRNKLISEADLARLERWIDVIEITSLRVLRGNELSSVIERYAQSICDDGPGSNVERFVPLLAAALTGSELHDPSTIAEALGKIGGIARPALPSLHDAATRTYRLCAPVERFTAEVQTTIREAIEKIEADLTG